MIDTKKIFKHAGKSDKFISVIQTDLDSIRSTLFGKFYEGVVAKHLEEKKKYSFLGKAAVNWADCIKTSKKDDFSQKLNNSLQQKIDNNKTRANPDGLYEKEGEYYLWEAKNWACWDEGKSSVFKQVRDLLNESSWLLGTKARVNGKEYQIDNFIFSWWDPFQDFNSIEVEVSESIGKPLDIMFTLDIIDDCRKNKYGWYQELINEQKKNIDEFFRELLGEK